VTLTRAELASYVDHTLVGTAPTVADVAGAVNDAWDLGAFAICIAPQFLPLADPGFLRVVTVCAFPDGGQSSEGKANDAASAFWAGAHEVDMVIDVAAAQRGEFAVVQADVAAVRAEVPDGRLLKVILETAVLTDQQIAGAAYAAEWAGADYIATSTGMHPSGGASVHAVEVIRETVGGRLGIKASGGIRTADGALALIAAGATRLGVSQTRAVLEGLSG
jgi:deoxyribose-phosphate aldolase